MKQEEKLEEAKRLYQTANADQRYVLESLFPELKESEDERIRKEIIKLVEFYYGSSLALKHTVSKDEMVAWLKKQGEQKSINNLTQQEAMDIAVAKCFEQGEQKQEENTPKYEPFRIKKGEWYVCIHDFCNKAIRVGEIIQAEHDNSIRGFDFLYMENKYFRPAFENEMPQKPKWTDEDEELLQHYKEEQ